MDAEDKRHAMTKDELLNSLIDENERLLDQLLLAQSRIEKQNGQLQNQKENLEELFNSFIDFASPYAASRLKQENEEGLRSEIKQKSKKFFHAPVKKGFWKRVRKDAGKKFASENAALRKALKEGASGDRIAKIIKDASLPHEQAATAFTEVARGLDKSDLKIEMAFRAWVLHPKPYRLKWLAFRCHEQDNNMLASLFLDMLPEDAPLTASEKSTSEQIHSKANEEYTNQARELFQRYLKGQVLARNEEAASQINENDMQLVDNYRTSLGIMRKFLNLD